MRFVYRTDKQGNVKAVVASERNPLRGTSADDVPQGTFQDTIMRNYAMLETRQQLPRWMNKGAIKRIHETAKAEGR